MKTVVCFSGGKDSCLALYKSKIDNCVLFNTVSDDYSRVRFHGVKDEIIRMQAEALGLELVQVKTRGKFYEKDFKKGIPEADRIVFGDIHLNHCLEWAKKVSGDLGMELSEPLWGLKPESVLKEFIESGFKAVVVSCQADLLDESFVGRVIDKTFLKDMSALGLDVCGENGEFHTLVLDGPVFKKRLEIKESEKARIGNYFFLDIKKCFLTDK